MSLIVEDESPLYKMADFNYTIMRIEEEEDNANSEQHKTSFASQLQKKFAISGIDDVLELSNAVFSFFFAILFVMDTQYDNIRQSVEEEGIYTPLWVEIIDIFMIVVLMGDWLLFFYLHHEDRIVYLFSFNSFIHFISVVPTAMVRFRVLADALIIQNFFLKFWRVLRLFSVMRMNKVFARRNLTIPRAYFRLYFVIFMTFYIFATSM
jgi:hypothetical protein